jgi:hypothetical protein
VPSDNQQRRRFYQPAGIAAIWLKRSLLGGRRSWQGVPVRYPKGSEFLLPIFKNNPSDNSLEISPASFCNWVYVAETAKALAQRH